MTDLTIITINKLKEPPISPLGTPICIDLLPITLSASPSGGEFSGIGITDNMFNTIKPGAYYSNYAYTSETDCTNPTGFI